MTSWKGAQSVPCPIWSSSYMAPMKLFLVCIVSDAHFELCEHTKQLMPASGTTFG